MNMKMKRGFAGLALCALAACAGTVMSPSKLADSEGSVRGAEEVGARQVPTAALQLKLAQDEVAKAKALNASGDGAAADRMLTRAQVDADLAIVLAKEASARHAAEMVMNEVKKAKGEIQ